MLVLVILLFYSSTQDNDVVDVLGDSGDSIYHLDRDSAEANEVAILPRDE